MAQVQATIASQRFSFRDDEVVARLGAVVPDPLEEHFVVVAGKRFPPKQVIAVLTGLDRADFNSHQARRILGRLGFVVGRRTVESQAPGDPGRSGPHGGREADLLRPFAGKWVAQRGLEVLVAGDTPRAVLQWLERHDQQADSMFRVPVDASEVGGVGPS